MGLNDGLSGKGVCAPATVNLIGLLTALAAPITVLLLGATYWSWMAYMTR